MKRAWIDMVKELKAEGINCTEEHVQRLISSTEPNERTVENFKFILRDAFETA